MGIELESLDLSTQRTISVYPIPLSTLDPVVIDVSRGALAWNAKTTFVSSADADKFEELLGDGWHWFWEKNCKVALQNGACVRFTQALSKQLFSLQK